MALTKAQISQVTVAALGAAPGGFAADLAAYNTQDELAAFLEGANLLGAGKTNAEYALEVKANAGGTASQDDVTALFNALEAGTSRAEAVVDFVGKQLVTANSAFNAKVDAAVSYTGGSTNLAELKAVVADKVDDGLTVVFNDGEINQDHDDGADTGETVNNIGKAQIDAGQSKISADFTFELENQIGETDQYNGLFLSPIIDRQAAESSGSQIFLELLDLRAEQDGKDPLERVPVDTFAFSLDGSQIIVQSDAIYQAKTYDELFAAIKDRVAELGNGVNVPTLNSDGVTPADAAAYAKLSGFTVEKGNLFTVTNQSGNEVSGTQIVLTDAGGATLTPQGFVNKAGVIPDPGYTLYAQLDNVPPTTVTKLITTNLDADNVGYGSQGASVNLAGQSASDKGVEEIKVTANNGVWLTTLTSKAATNHLERIELQTGSDSYFRVGTQKNAASHVVDLVDQDFSKGGLVDVQELAAGAAESVAINSFVSDNILGRFEHDDTGIYTADDSQATVDYDLTSGNDVLNLAIDTDILESVDVQVDVNSGAGDDVITLMATKGLTSNKAVAVQETGATGWVINQQLLDNVKIDAGAGNDWIMTTGAGAVDIDAGAGNDVVRVDNAGDRGVFVFNDATTDITTLANNRDIVSNSDDALTSGANAVAQTYNFFKAQVQVSFKGFESDFIEIASTDYRTTTEQINQAVKKAVNSDPVLNKLLHAVENEGHALAIESLIDGLLATNELTINIIEPVAYNAAETAAAKALREDAGQLMLATDDLTKADTAYKVAANTTAIGDVQTAVNNAETLYASDFGTKSTGSNTTTTVATTTAGAFEVQNFDLAAVSVANGETLTFTIDGNPVVYTNGSGGGLTGAALAADIAGNLAPAAVNGATYTATQSGATSTLVITQSVLSKNIADITAVNQTPASGTIGAPATGSVNGADEVQTLDLSNVTVANGQTLIFTSAALSGGSVTYTNGTGSDISGAALATAVAGQIDVAGANEAASAAGNVVTVTYNGQQAGAAGDVAQIVVTGTGAGTNTLVQTDYAGAASGAESDNVVNLASGQDVLTLGTGALSNDTVEITGYNLGENSIVNFTTGAPTKANGADLLDFSSYLTSVNATTKAPIAKTVLATNADTLTDNSVTVLEFNDGTAMEIADSAVTFESLTAANVKAMINGTEAGGTDYFGELDLALTAGTAGSTSNYVILVHDNAQGANANNEGAYKAFHVTSSGTSTDAADVKLIGTFDFGENASGDSYLDGLVAANLV